jgi:hypothetical protein
MQAQQQQQQYPCTQQQQQQYPCTQAQQQQVQQQQQQQRCDVYKIARRHAITATTCKQRQSKLRMHLFSLPAHQQALITHRLLLCPVTVPGHALAALSSSGPTPTEVAAQWQVRTRCFVCCVLLVIFKTIFITTAYTVYGASTLVQLCENAFGVVMGGGGARGKEVATGDCHGKVICLVI